jgi:ribonuclease HIII
MGIPTQFKTLENAYSVIKAKLLTHRLQVTDYEEIQLGIQFIIQDQKKSDLVRVFSSKKGISVDLSQIKNKDFESILNTILKVESDLSIAPQINKRQPKVYSLCIGINTFSDENLTSLDYAEADATEMHTLLSNKFGFGDGTHLLINNDATKENIQDCINKIKIIAKEEDTVIILITTHGEFIYNDFQSDFYLLTTDTQLKKIPETSIPMIFLKNEIKTIKSKNKIIFLDACYSGGICKSKKGTEITESIKEKIFNDFQSEEYIIITSSQATQRSWESDEIKHGVFSYYLINGLSGAVSYANGQVDIMNLYLFLHSSVSNYVKEKFSRKQEPKFFGSITGNICLPLLTELKETDDKYNKNTNKKKFSFENIRCIGIDESGKGDFFGPLVTAGVYVNTEEKVEKLLTLGVRDSKTLSDEKILLLAKQIKKICDHEVILVLPPKYNQLYSNMPNLNHILAWCHAQSLEQILKRNSDCNMAISDQFAAKEVLLNKLKTMGKQIELIQRPRAEENIAVAAASILARAKFLDVMNIMEQKFNHKFSKGANQQVIKEGIDFLSKGGNLSQVSKQHFTTTKNILDSVEIKRTHKY